MSPPEALAVLLAGCAAGAINTIVGSGSLVTFPTLLAVGYPPVVANVTNTVGLLPGSVSGAIGYRAELAGQRGRVLRLGAASAAGGLIGGLLLLALPGSVFEAVVPALILLACALMAVQPVLTRRLAGRDRAAHGGPLLWLGVLLTGVYGGYFGAAQGVILMALLAIGIDDDLQRLNGLKNVLAGLVNAVAAVLFVLASHVAWVPALLLAVGSTAGAQVGARVGRRLRPSVLRATVIVVGLVVTVVLVLT